MDVRQVVLESTRFSQDAGFAETPSRMIATAVSELVRNILKYAGSGDFRIRRITGSLGVGIEIEISDPGIVLQFLVKIIHFGFAPLSDEVRLRFDAILI